MIAVSGPALSSDQKILVLGDSISAAYGMSLEQGWVAQLAARLEPDYTVINASISGETTEGGLRRLPHLLQTHQPEVVIVELGGNDGLRGYPLSALADNLTRITDMAHQSGAKVILVPMEIPPNYGIRYTDGFRQTFRSVAKSTGSTLTPFILDGVATRQNLMQSDGIHPTVEAQTYMLENVLAPVQRVLAAP